MDGGGDSADGTVRRPPSRAVVEAVAEAEEISPDELRPPEYEPLHAVVDPEALDALFADRPTAKSGVSFTFCGYDVSVDEDGTVSLSENSAGDESG
ncbi:HalOD1 output domain-containing protein [Natrarchaeobius sp. A-rgal3]|uniref:HalOD1 output domain-containing protein n=1 Tax=Natrarchaeobius versutus TaxID=1679078 RepID=UPI00350EFE5A